jgi:hypothetical protein
VGECEKSKLTELSGHREVLEDAVVLVKPIRGGLGKGVRRWYSGENGGGARAEGEESRESLMGAVP